MTSGKKIFVGIDLISLFMIFSILFVILYYIQTNLKKQYIQLQHEEVQKIDFLIKSTFTERQIEFNHIIKDPEILTYNYLFTYFSDIFILDSTLTVKQILKKEDKSKIFLGYSYKYSKLNLFTDNLPANLTSYSPMFLTPERDETSIYIAKKIGDLIFVGRIGIDKINQTIKTIAEYNNNILIIATKDGYIVTSSSDKIPFNVLPSYSVNEYNFGKDFLYTRLRSKTLNNDIVLLKPLSDVYLIINTIKNIYPLFSLIILIVFFIKSSLQFLYIFYPLERLVRYIKNWDTRLSVEQFDDIKIKTQEINYLFETFSSKTEAIRSYISTIKNTNKDIYHIKQYLKNIIDSMPSILIAIDLKGTILEWNKSASEYFEIENDDALDKCLWELIPAFDQYSSHCKEVINRKHIIELKRQLFRFNGDKYLNISLFPLDDNGIRSMAILIEDNTQLEKTELILIQSQKMETIGTLAGGIAHDFNNILGGIVGTLSILKLKFTKANDLNPLRETINNYLSIIESSSNRATDLVKHLLTLSRKQEPKLTVFDLNTILYEVSKICKNTFDKSIELKINVFPSNALVKADLNQIEQAILNLAVNASHSMTIMRINEDQHGGILTINLNKIRSDKHFIKNHPQAKDSVDYWIISVSDTGVGIEANILNKIFDPFFTTKEKGKGTGLGLAMVYNIVKIHEGFIDVYSEPGTGTTVNVYLPISDSEEMSFDLEQEHIIKTGEGTILVIDDEILIRQTYNDMLSECGYSVLMASDGDEGIKIYLSNQDKITGVILDMSMPKKSGIETYIELKAINPEIKVLMASGFRQDDRVVKALNLGVNGFLQKPFTIDILSQALAIIYQS